MTKTTWTFLILCNKWDHVGVGHVHVQSAHGDDDYKPSTIKSKDISGDWSLQLCRQLLVSFSKSLKSWHFRVWLSLFIHKVSVRVKSVSHFYEPQMRSRDRIHLPVITFTFFIAVTVSDFFGWLVRDNKLVTPRMVHTASPNSELNCWLQTDDYKEVMLERKRLLQVLIFFIWGLFFTSR